MYTLFSTHDEGLHSGHGKSKSPSICLVSHILRDVQFQPSLPHTYFVGDSIIMNQDFPPKSSFDTNNPATLPLVSPLSCFSSDGSFFDTPSSAFLTPMLLPSTPATLDGIESHPSTPSNVPATATLPSDPKSRRKTRCNTAHKVEKPRSKAIRFPAKALEPSFEKACDSKLTEEEHIKRPPNAFMLFRKSFYRSVKLVEKHNANISSHAGQTWAEMPEEDKACYFAEAKALKEEHRRLYPNWKYRPKRGKGPKKPRKSPKKFQNHEALIRPWIDGKRGEEYQKQVEAEGLLGERCLPAGAEERKRAKLESAVKASRPKPKGRRVSAQHNSVAITNEQSISSQEEWIGNTPQGGVPLVGGYQLVSHLRSLQLVRWVNHIP